MWPNASVGGRGDVVGRAGPAVQPAEPALAGQQADAVHHVAAEHLDGRADLDLAVVGGDDQDGARREDVEDVGDEAVDETQLGVVVLAEAVRVGDPVDAVVVGVDERLAGREQPPDLDDEPGRRPQPVEGRVAEVGGAEAGGGVVGAGDDRGGGMAGEGRVRLERPWPEHGAGVGPPEPPAEDVEHGAVDAEPVADDAVDGRRQPGRQRGQGGRRRARGDRRDRAAGGRRQGRGAGRPSPELLPAEAVEDQQDDLAGPSDRGGHPVRQGGRIGAGGPGRAAPGRRWRCTGRRRPAGPGSVARCSPANSRPADRTRPQFAPDGGRLPVREGLDPR